MPEYRIRCFAPLGQPSEESEALDAQTAIALCAVFSIVIEVVAQPKEVEALSSLKPLTSEVAIT